VRQYIEGSGLIGDILCWRFEGDKVPMLTLGLDMVSWQSTHVGCTKVLPGTREAWQYKSLPARAKASSHLRAVLPQEDSAAIHLVGTDPHASATLEGGRRCRFRSARRFRLLIYRITDG
jgi:hypothetical protein